MKPIPIKEFVSQVKSGQIKPVSYVKEVLSEIESSNKKFNHFSLISSKNALKQAKELEKNIKKWKETEKKARKNLTKAVDFIINEMEKQI